MLGPAIFFSAILDMSNSVAFYLQAFYLPWAMLALDVIFGSPIMPDLLGIIAGHLYYFLTVLHPLAGGKNILKTPVWVYPFAVTENQNCVTSTK